MKYLADLHDRHAKRCKSMDTMGLNSLCKNSGQQQLDGVTRNELLRECLYKGGGIWPEQRQAPVNENKEKIWHAALAGRFTDDMPEDYQNLTEHGLDKDEPFYGQIFTNHGHSIPPPDGQFIGTQIENNEESISKFIIFRKNVLNVPTVKQKLQYGKEYETIYVLHATTTEAARGMLTDRNFIIGYSASGAAKRNG